MPHRVLVVDDEEPIRSAIKDTLEPLGFKVVTAADGDQGIKVFGQSKPHLAIIDFLLPKKNGFAVAEAIRKSDLPKTPILMMSGVFKNPKTAVEAREKYQVIDFLSKPLDFNNLTRLVNRALDGVDPGPEPDPPPQPAKSRSEEAPKPEPRSVRVAAMQSSDSLVPQSSQSQSLQPQPLAPQPVVSKPPPRGLSYGAKSAPSLPAMPSSTPRAPSLEQPSSRAPSMRDQIVGGVFQGRPFPRIGEHGSVEQHPVALLLSALRYDRMTGMLDLTDQGTHRRIYIMQGQPTFMQSNAEGENVGALLLRRGRVTDPDFERCTRYMKEKGRTLQQALLDLKLVNDQDLATAYKLLAGQLMPLALGQAGGTYNWRETDAFVGRVPEGKFEPVSVIFEGIKRHVHPPQILRFFKGREDVPLVKSLELDKLMPYFRRAFSASNIAAKIDGSATYRSITRSMAAETAAVVPQLFALVTSGMTVLPEVGDHNLFEVAVNQAAAEIEDMNIDRGELDLGLDDNPVPESGRSRAQVERYHAEIMSQDFFKIFGVDRDADESRIKAAYFELAKKWQPDSFGGVDLGSARRKLEEIFQRITEAYETIVNKSKRDEYITFLDRKAKGLPTDANQLFRAEQLYDQAVAMLKRRDYNGARPVLQEALRINPDPLYVASLGWATYNINPSSQQHVMEAVGLLKKSLQEQEISLAYQYLGQITADRGQAAEARRWWQKCLELEPGNIEAARGLRQLEQRPEASKSPPPQPGSKSFIGKILKK